MCAGSQFTLGQPEAFIQAQEGLFDDGNIGPMSEKFLRDWMKRFTSRVEKHAG